MKQLLIAFLITATGSLKAQFELEHTYDSAAAYNFCAKGLSQLLYVDLEASGEHYVRINRCGELISLYDMDHNLVKNISMSMLHTDPPYNVIGSIMYISEHLFNLDDRLEFMYVVDSGDYYITNVYNELGEVLFSEPGMPSVVLNFHMQQFPIYNTDEGTKLILSYQNNQAKVFGLEGILTTAIEVANQELTTGAALAAALSGPYPNPADNYTTIDYTLPESTNTGELVLYALNGAEVGRYAISNAFTSIDIPTSTLLSGTYYFELQTEAEIVSGKKLIVIR